MKSSNNELIEAIAVARQTLFDTGLIELKGNRMVPVPGLHIYSLHFSRAHRISRAYNTLAEFHATLSLSTSEAASDEQEAAA